MKFKRILTPLLLILLLASTIAFGTSQPIGPYYDDNYLNYGSDGLTVKQNVTTVTTTHTMTIAEQGTVLVSASSDYTITLPTAVGNTGLTYKFKKTDANYNCITLDGNGSETINYENADGVPKETYARLNTYGAEVTLVSDGSNWQAYDEALGQVPECRVFLGSSILNIPDSKTVKINFNTENYDIGNNFDMSVWVSGTADGDVENHLQDDSNSQFTPEMVGWRVRNTSDTTYAWITAYNDAGDVTLSADIFPNGNENYEIDNSKFVVPISGKYSIICSTAFDGVVADKVYQGNYSSGGSAKATIRYHSSSTNKIYFVYSDTYSGTAGDDIFFQVYNISGGATTDIYSGHTWAIIRLISKD